MTNLTRENRILNGPPTQSDYERVVDEAATLRMHKVNSYGEDRYTSGEGDRFDMTMTFSDVYRKYIRIKEQVLEGKWTNDDGESLRDAFLDLANYALMGAQLCDKHKIGQASHPAYYPTTVPAKTIVNHIDQIAIRTTDPDATKELLELIFETAINEPLKWHNDIVEAHGRVFDENMDNQAQLGFNYQLCVGGLEFEVLKYDDPQEAYQKGKDNWLDAAGAPARCFSHIGVHTEDIGPWKSRMKQLGFGIAQEVVTQSHTNAHIADTRRYHYVIFNTAERLGFYLKLIQRLPYGGKNWSLNMGGEPVEDED